MGRSTQTEVASMTATYALRREHRMNILDLHKKARAEVAMDGERIEVE